MSKISRAEQAGRRLAEAINENAHLLYQKNTKKNFFRGLIKNLNHPSVCHTCFKKYHCKGYDKEIIACDKYIDQVIVI